MQQALSCQRSTPRIYILKDGCVVFIQETELAFCLKTTINDCILFSEFCLFLYLSFCMVEKMIFSVLALCLPHIIIWFLINFYYFYYCFIVLSVDCINKIRSDFY